MGESSDSKLPRVQSLSRPFWTLFAVSFVALSLLVGTLTYKLNDNALRTSEKVLDSILADRIDRIATLSLEYGYWDEAVENLVEEFDDEWVDATLSEYIFEDLGMHSVFVVGVENAPVVSLVGGERVAQGAVEQFGGPMKKLIADALASPDGRAPVPMSGFLVADGVYYLAGAVRMTTYTNLWDISTDHVMILVEPFDREVLWAISRRYLMPGLAIANTEPGRWEAGYAFSLYGEQPSARFIWQPALPGFEILPYLAIGLVLTFIAMLLTALLFVRRTNQVFNDLNEARLQADLASTAKSNFLAAMSHDLRTPLNSILGFSDLIRQETFGPLANERYKSYLDDVHHSGTLLVSLVDDILDLSKIEAGKYKLEDEQIDLASTLNSNVRQVSKLAEMSEIEIDLDVPDPPPKLLADPKVLARILNNLLSNAIKFTPKGGKIAVATRRQSDGSINVCVSDSGSGMTASEIEVALRPFEQPRQSTAKDHQGTGLGLFLSKNFMEIHGGYLQVDSTPMVGTKILLGFPPERTQT